MGGHPDRNGVEARRHFPRHDSPGGEDQCQGTGPEQLHEPSGPPVHQDGRFCVPGRGKMQDQGIVRGTPLGGIDFRRRSRVEAVRPEAVDGLRGKGDEAAASEKLRSLSDGLRVRVPGIHGENAGKTHSASPPEKRPRKARRNSGNLPSRIAFLISSPRRIRNRRLCQLHSLEARISPERYRWRI